VPDVSTARKLGIAARIAADQLGKNRLVGALRSGVGATAKSFARIFHILWLEVSGFFFLILALMLVLATWREYSKYQTGVVPLNRVYLAGAFAAMFTYFGVSSFWQARRKKKK
jgi:hypothetical protein